MEKNTQNFHLQSIGLINDHDAGCFRGRQLLDSQPTCICRDEPAGTSSPNHRSVWK